MNELIEKLKKNEKPFGLLAPEEQECLKKAGKKNCLFYGSSGWEPKEADETFCVWQTYAINLDYQPVPKFVDVEIVIQEHTSDRTCLYVLGCIYTDEYIFIPLYKLPSLPNFEYFWKNHCHEVIYLDMVAKIIARGHKVYARFRV